MRVIVCWVIFLVLQGNPAKAAAPVKLEVEVGWMTVRAGDPVPVRVRLLDAANQAVNAPKPLEVLLQARLSSGEVRPLRTAGFAPGQLVKEVTITPPGKGLVYIWAKHGELLPGGAFVNVREAAEPERPAPPPRISPDTVPAPQPEPQVRDRIIPQLALRFSPDRRFLADGKDAVTIQAFRLNAPAQTVNDIRLSLYDSSGTLKPAPLVIHEGQESASAALTFNNPGTVTVEFLSSAPPAELIGDRKLQIHFMPPIAHLALEASPPAISLVDGADLVATLVDDQGRPVATDAARHVTFAIQSGHGEISRSDVEIAAGEFQARSSFRPTSPERVEIAASTPNLLSVVAPLQVSAPILLIGCSLAGGLLGGYLSFMKNRRRGRRRIGIGVATGFIFYWACIFLGLGAVGHGVVVNPLSAFALSAVGGWLQTEVFTMIGSKVKV